jgi:hypothetical protein
LVRRPSRRFRSIAVDRGALFAPNLLSDHIYLISFVLYLRSHRNARAAALHGGNDAYYQNQTR